jgi:hypothetical protein
MKILKNLEKFDKYFLIILIIGGVLRFIAVLNLPLNVDSYTFIKAGMGILEFNYNKYGTFRPPAFPLLIGIFLLITDNGIASAKLASFTSSILLLIICYYVFTRATKKFLDKNKRSKEIAKYTGLIVSLLISFNIYFIIHPGYGIREEYLSLWSILIFYFIVIKEKTTLKDNIYLSFSICMLTLTLITTGLFFVVGIILFFLISRLKWFKFKLIPTKKVLIIIISFLLTFFIWALFSYSTWGDALYNWSHQSTFFRNFYRMQLDSLENIIEAIINALIGGIPLEIYYMFFFISFFFVIIMLYNIIKNIRAKQMLFLFLVVGINLLYLSVFIAPSKLIGIPNSSRVMVYLLPFIYYIGVLPISNILVEIKTKEKEFPNYIVISLSIFLITYIFKGIPFIIILGYGGFPFPPHPVIIILFCLNEISILIFLITTKDIKYPRIKNENIKAISND